MDTQNKKLLPLSSQQSLKVVGFDDPLIARVPYDLYEARARDSVIRMDGSTRNSCGICRRRIVKLRRFNTINIY